MSHISTFNVNWTIKGNGKATGKNIAKSFRLCRNSNKLLPKITNDTV